MEYPYLISIALIKADSKRAMPIGGKSIKELIGPKDCPLQKGESIALELLLRLFQRSQENAIQRAAGDKSILLIQIEMSEMQERLPELKAAWINNGDTELLLSNLSKISQGIWSLKFIKHEGVISQKII